MLSSKANWKYINNPPVKDRDSIEIELSPIVKDLFLQRGITTTEEAKQFMQPDLNNLIDPFLLSGMEKTVQRIKEAANNNEKIAVYGDYDADGVSSTVVLLHALKKLVQIVNTIFRIDLQKDMDLMNQRLDSFNKQDLG